MLYTLSWENARLMVQKTLIAFENFDQRDLK